MPIRLLVSEISGEVLSSDTSIIFPAEWLYLLDTVMASAGAHDGQ